MGNSRSLPVTTLTPFHALNEASLQINEYLLVFGASGNTGIMAVQFAKKMGAKVIAVSRDDWVKDFGADYIINEYDKVVEKVKEITRGKMAHRKGWHASCSYSVNGCRLQTGQQRTLVGCTYLT